MGVRNPYGLAFNDKGRLYASINGADDKVMDNRPIANDSDKFVEVPLDNDELPFFGWPDFAGDAEPVTDEKFRPERGPQPQFLMQDHPEVEKPLALIGVAVGSTQVDFASGSFGEHSNMAFVGEIGSMAPVTHPTESVVPEEELEKVGGKVIVVDPETGLFTDFVSLSEDDISFRPVGIAFNDDDNALYIASIGKFHIRTAAPNGAELPEPTPWGYPYSGVVWKVTGTDADADAAIEQTTEDETLPSEATPEDEEPFGTPRTELFDDSEEGTFTTPEEEPRLTPEEEAQPFGTPVLGEEELEAEEEEMIPRTEDAGEIPTTPDEDPLSAPGAEQEESITPIPDDEVVPTPEEEAKPTPSEEEDPVAPEATEKIEEGVEVEEETTTAPESTEPEQQPEEEIITHEVSILGVEDPYYGPNEITVDVGETITFENTDSLLHTATSIESHEGDPIPDGIFDTGLLSSGQTGEVTIDEPGTYPYFCSVHPNMRGTVTVTR